MPRDLSLIVLVLLIIALSTSAVSFAEPATNTQPSPAYTGAVSPHNEAIEDRLTERFQAEREVLERQADRQAAGIASLIEVMLWVIGAIFAAAAAVFYWTWGSTRSEMLSSIRAVATEQVRQLVEAQALPVRERIASIQREIDELRAKRSAVTWIVRSNEEDNNELLANLQARNIDVSILAPGVGEQFLLGDTELVVISYQATEEGARIIRDTLDQLRRRAPMVPLVIYTFNPERQDNRLLPGHAALLDHYRWFVPANFPLQLIAHVGSLTINRAVELRNA